MVNLHFETCGEPSNPSIMLLHGFMSSNAQWLMNVDALRQHYHLVMVELWGHGASPLAPSKAQYSVEGYVAEFERIRSALGIERWHLIGQSYGAGLVIQYAIAKPERVTSLVVTNSRSAFGRATTSDRPGKGANMAEPDLRKLPFHPIHARRFPPHVKEALVNAADKMTNEAVMLSGGLGGRLNCVDLLGQVTVPMLLTNGVFEKSFQKDLAALRESHPDLRVADLEGGHSVNIEAHEGFNEAVLAFLPT